MSRKLNKFEIATFALNAVSVLVTSAGVGLTTYQLLHTIDPFMNSLIWLAMIGIGVGLAMLIVSVLMLRKYVVTLKNERDSATNLARTNRTAVLSGLQAELSNAQTERNRKEKDWEHTRRNNSRNTRQAKRSLRDFQHADNVVRKIERNILLIH